MKAVAHILKAAWINAKQRRGSIVGMALIIGIGICLGQVVICTYPRRNFANTANHSSCGIVHIDNIDYVVTSKKLVCGEWYGIIPQKYTSLRDDATLARCRVLESALPKSILHVHMFPDGAVVSIACSLQVKCFDDERLMRIALRSSRQYTELVVAGWPMRTAMSYGGTSIIKIFDRASFVIDSPVYEYGRGGRVYGVGFQYLIGYVPLRMIISGLIVNTLLFAAAASVLIWLIYVCCAFSRGSRKRCVVCGYPVQGIKERCPECGYGIIT